MDDPTRCGFVQDCAQEWTSPGHASSLTPKPTPGALYFCLEEWQWPHLLGIKVSLALWVGSSHSSLFLIL